MTKNLSYILQYDMMHNAPYIKICYNLTILQLFKIKPCKLLGFMNLIPLPTI